jgi:hypothetical protein
LTPPPRTIEQFCSAHGVKITFRSTFAYITGVLRDDKQLPTGTPNAS